MSTYAIQHIYVSTSSKKYLSDSDDSKCMKNVCRNCQPAKISYSWNADLLSSLREIDTRELSDDDISDYISFTMWICQDKEIKKGAKCLEQKEFHEDGEQMTMELKEHIHRKQVAANNLFNTDLKQG